MSLRNKLLLLALSTLILPFAGWQLVRQLEGLLREGQAQAQLASAEALARALATRADALPPTGPGFYVQSASEPFVLDGYDEDWREQRIAPQSYPGGLRLARIGLLVEPTSASVAAAFARLTARGVIAERESTAMLISGTGIKTASTIAELF